MHVSDASKSTKHLHNRASDKLREHNHAQVPQELPGKFNSIWVLLYSELKYTHLTLAGACGAL